MLDLLLFYIIFSYVSTISMSLDSVTFAFKDDLEIPTKLQKVSFFILIWIISPITMLLIINKAVLNLVNSSSKWTTKD